MKLSQNTLTILKNFATINKGIVFHPGNKLFSRRESLIADATIAESFEVEKGVADLSQLLNIIALYNDPVLEFGEKFLRVAESDGAAETKYGYAPPGIVTGGTVPKKKTMEITEQVIDFVLTEEQWIKLQKATSILSREEVKITSDGKVVRIGTAGKKTEDQSSFSLVLEADAHGVSCNMVYKRDDMPLLKGSYTGKVGPKFAVFTNTSGLELVYIVAADPATRMFGVEESKAAISE